MNNFFKENLVLVLAFSIPLIFIIIVVIIVYLPAKLIYSDYEFAYVQCSGYFAYSCEDITNYYRVTDGKISISEYDEDMNIESNKITVTHKRSENSYDRFSTFKFFIYNTKTDESRAVNIDELKELSFFDEDVSPDGYSVVDEYVGSHDVFPFYFSSSHYGIFLKNNKNRREIVLDGGSRDIDFLGWVLPNEK